MALLTFEIAALTNATTGATDAGKTYQFQHLLGTIQNARERVRAIERPGVDYHGIRTEGKVGPEFVLVSIEYGNTLAYLDGRLGEYQDLQGHSLGVKITQFSAGIFPADVLEARLAKFPQQLRNAAGSLVANPLWEMRAIWRLRLRQA